MLRVANAVDTALTSSTTKSMSDYLSSKFKDNDSQSTQVAHTCQTTADRNKKDLVDFFAQSEEFTDVDFQKRDALYWDDYESEKYSFVGQLAKNIRWVRASKEFSKATLWGDDGIMPSDIK